ncbi:integral membrane protein DUF92-domain-containing protein [Zychaea mexicana]|uniref:integral membrane protein DUF92-domain-containing protein n=1 Tax=Zychaea mexicana TaxID=64656 RepID=UPI0022FF07E2|nr:integral membrane protein DUF92-domain-containing protein [Zychaea mexicana]KAI9498939.1 integral membrane protein DUF92-domain-containing protein [Zychaea mexicana]
MPNYLFALGLSILLVIHSRRKKSLSPNGAAGAFILGMATFTSTYAYFTVVLLTFFLASSKLTKFKAERKRLLEADYDHSSERTLIQVACNGLTGGIIAALFQVLYEGNLSCFDQDRNSLILFWAYMGHYGCCAGDTWASELGILNRSWPISIIRFKKVPPGTNGGVSPLGLAASIAGGAAVGLAGAITLWIQQPCHGTPWDIVLLGALAGLGGSLIDSILGATVQRTLYSEKQKMVVEDEKDASVISGLNILDNHQVNFVSSVLTSAICGAAAYYMH